MLSFVFAMCLGQRVDHIVNWQSVAGELAPIVESATGVNAFAINGDATTSQGVFHGVPIVGRDRDPWPFLLPELINTLATGLYRPLSWSYPDGVAVVSTKPCGAFEPDFAYSFQTPRGVVDLLLRFECAQAELWFGDRVIALNIDRIARRLVQLAFWSFPLEIALSDAEKTTRVNEENAGKPVE